MLVEVKVPQLSESVAEATLVSWHKKTGEFVKRDENLIDIETDKVVLELPAPESGVLARIIKGDGGTVASNEVIATIARLRQRVAQRLVESQSTAAILTTFNEINMQPVMDLRNRYKDKFEKEHGVKLGFMSFFVKAAVTALKRYPVVNASIDGNDIIYHGYYDVGIAVGTERGLVVPILRNADQLSIADIE